MHNIERLPTSGTFDAAAPRRWTDHTALTGSRWLSLSEYQCVLTSAGMPDDAASDVVARMRQHGAERLYWRGAQVSRASKIQTSWTVLVAATKTPAAEAVPAVTSMGPPPAGAASLCAFIDHPAVLQAYSAPARHTIAQGTRRFGRIKLRTRAESAFAFSAEAALARGNVGATIQVGADTRTAAESALGHLIELVLRDLEDPVATEPAGSPPR